MPWRCKSGVIRVSDPGYSYKIGVNRRGLNLATVIKNAKKGDWLAKVKRYHPYGVSPGTGRYKGAIAVLITYVRDTKLPKFKTNMWKEHRNTAPVDSGQCGIFDNSSYPKGDTTGDYEDKESFYGKAAKITMSKKGYGIINKMGVVAQSGWGDGSYPIYTLTEKKKIVAVAIEFIDPSLE